MKKLAIILAILMIPAFAFGMDTISDSDLEAVTGQAGVSIALNSIQIETSGGTTSYGDADQSKWVSIVGLRTSVRTIGFHASIPLHFDALTIDIVDMTNVDGWDLTSMVVSTDMPTNSDAAIKIVLPDIIQIEQARDQVRVIYMADGFDPGDTLNVLSDELIRIYNTAGTTRIVAADMGTSFTAYTGAIMASTNLTAATYTSGLNTSILISAH